MTAGHAWSPGLLSAVTALASAVIASAAASAVNGGLLKVVTWLAVIAICLGGVSLVRSLACRREAGARQGAAPEEEP